MAWLSWTRLVAVRAPVDVRSTVFLCTPTFGLELCIPLHNRRPHDDENRAASIIMAWGGLHSLPSAYRHGMILKIRNAGNGLWLSCHYTRPN
ncbi:hypothetical protein BKA63DRAFT_498540 [Paraphoma chrysanthemicola]|nr:hypothetical protein BKA63DRAFT_498540 [Paraphoma chrysanthemicola]